MATGHGRVAAIDELRVNACADVAAEGVLGAGVKIAEAPGGEPGCAPSRAARKALCGCADSKNHDHKLGGWMLWQARSNGG